MLTRYPVDLMERSTYRSDWFRVFALGLCLILGVGGASCSSSDETDSEQDTGTETQDTNVSVDGDLPDEFSFDSEYKMRFTDFGFTEESPGTVANNLIDDFLDQSIEFPIVVLLHLKEISAEDGTARLRAGAGLKVDKSCVPEGDKECEYEWDPDGGFEPGGGLGEIQSCAERIGEGSPPSDETSDAGGTGDGADAGSGGDPGGGEAQFVDIELDPETGELKGALARLDFIGTTQFEDGSVEKFTLPINNVVFKDAFLRPADGEVQIKTGRLRGYITEKAAQENEVRITQSGDPVPIAEVITDDLNYDADGDGTFDSWCMEATFSAGETNIVE